MYTSLNPFHSALKYTWGISENLLAFLDIKLFINDNVALQTNWFS